ncbi:MAG: (2Fe-2S)-binding protein [Chloroflexota bacterium]
MILNVNGSRHEVQDGTRTLLEVLRDNLGLVGAKEGCGVGMCGTCTVLVGGNPVSGCLTLAAQAADKEIMTVEGLAKDGELHPIQQAFIDDRAFQCAYCTPGVLLSTVALLNENLNPSEQETREYLSGNLCRCVSYQNILRAISQSSKRLR